MLNIKKLALVSTTALTLIAAPAFASEGSAPAQSSSSNSGLYVTGGAGINIGRYKLSGAFSDKGKKTTGAFFVGIGAPIADNFRADVTLNFTPSTNYAEKNSGVNYSIQTTALFANAYYHFLDGSISPYATAGLGFSRNNLEIDTTTDKTRTSFAWQVGVGVSGPISENLTWDVGYRYVNSGKVATKALSKAKGFKDSLKSHVFLAGIRVGL